MIYNTKAIILNKINYGDSSLICNTFTIDYGKITIISKGARSKKNQNSAILQPVNYIELIYYHKAQRNIQILKEANLITNFAKLSKNYNKMICALTVIDFINKISLDSCPCDIIFRLTKQTLKKLEICNENEINLYFSFFQLQLLIYLGYQPNFFTCYSCQKKIDNGSFSKSLGQIVCKNCSNNNILSVNQNILQIILFLMTTHIDQIHNNYDEKKYNIIDKLLNAFILFHLPEIQKSKVLKQHNIS